MRKCARAIHKLLPVTIERHTVSFEKHVLYACCGANTILFEDRTLRGSSLRLTLVGTEQRCRGSRQQWHYNQFFSYHLATPPGRTRKLCEALPVGGTRSSIAHSSPARTDFIIASAERPRSRRPGICTARNIPDAALPTNATTCGQFCRWEARSPWTAVLTRPVRGPSKAVHRARAP